MLLADLAAASRAVADAPGRRDKVAILADALGRLEPGEIAAGTAFLAGELTQRQIGVGWAALRDLPAPAGAPSLTVGEVDRILGRVGATAGPGSQAARRHLLADLFARATAPERDFLERLLVGGLRQGALTGVVADAVARAAGVPAAQVRRALMLRGDLPAVARIALTDGAAGLAALGLEVGRPLLPMLAGTAEDVDAAIARAGPAAVEWKLDGARVQVHREGADVAVFTRSLDEITDRVPEVAEAVLALPARALVVDGEAIALGPDGRPRPFPETASRIGSRTDVAGRRARVPLTPVIFDVLHADGQDLIDRDGGERFAALAALVPAALRVPRVVAEDAAAARAALDAALAAGHEGVMVKSLAAAYEAGRRGAGWLKVKPVHTLDLVVLAAEWGHGRRRGWLSNLHLGARADDGAGFVMVGKTFKGLTDAMLAWQTGRLLALEVAREGIVVHVRPELVVEVALDGVQRSPRAPAGIALRFARVRRYREDKAAADADTVAAARALGPPVRP